MVVDVQRNEFMQSCRSGRCRQSANRGEPSKQNASIGHQATSNSSSPQATNNHARGILGSTWYSENVILVYCLRITERIHNLPCAVIRHL